MDGYILVGRRRSYPFWSIFHQVVLYLIGSAVCVFVGISLGLSGFNLKNMITIVASIVVKYQNLLSLLTIGACALFIVSTLGLLVTVGDLRKEL